MNVDKPTSASVSSRSSARKRLRSRSNSPKVYVDHAAEKKKKKKQKLEALLTAGCGSGRPKKRRVQAFWSALWPKLTEGGWTKEDGEGDEEGAIYFVPPGVDTSTSLKGKDFYTQIKEVISLVQDNSKFSRGDETIQVECSAAEAYQVKLQSLEETDNAAEEKLSANEGKSVRRGRPRRECPTTSWTQNRKQYPKICSRVGDSYQATFLPEAMRSTESLDLPRDGAENAEYDQVWCPKQAEKAGYDIASFMEEEVPQNKREMAMVLLHQRNYEIDGLLDEMKKIPPRDGSDWTRDERDIFHSLIFDTRKDMHAVAKALDKSVGSCLTYYLGIYKTTDGYEVLKETCSKERLDRAPDDSADACGICRGGGNLLLCDSCGKGYHLGCLTPRLTMVPEGTWDCEACLNKKLAKAGRCLLENLLRVSSREAEMIDRQKHGRASASNECRIAEAKIPVPIGLPRGWKVSGTATNAKPVAETKASILTEATKRFLRTMGTPFEIN